MAKHWRIFGHDVAQIAELERAANVPPIVAQLLLRRGIGDPQTARMFLEARLSQLRAPESLPGVPQAVDVIVEHVRSRNPIVIHGDYDADGMTATAILHGCLARLGATVDTFVPNRMEEGYGLHPDTLTRLHADGTRLVISVDCGIASLTAAETARSLGLDLVITDHHTLADQLPHAAAIVHPKLPGTDYPFAGLCGAGVAFKLAWALCKAVEGTERVSSELRDFLLRAVGLAALGTVADVVPLVDENRILVKQGVTSLESNAPPGLVQLMAVTKVNQKSSLSAEDLAFMIAPRLNAAGRLGQAALGVELLTTESPERAAALAQYLHELNQTRDKLERSIYLAAKKQAEQEYDPAADPALVLAGTDWHAGVIGIVAGRLADKYHRPVILISLDGVGAKPGIGSCRSPGGLNLHSALAACAQFLKGFGGHAAAAGLQIEANQVDGFRNAFCEFAAESISAADRIAEIEIDAEAALAQLTIPIVQQIEQLAPFGTGNPRPILCASDVRLAEPPKRMGSGDRHLALRVDQLGTRLRAVAFGQGEWADPLSQHDGTIDLAFRPVINEFRGRKSVELHVVDWRPANSTTSCPSPLASSCPPHSQLPTQ